MHLGSLLLFVACQKPVSPMPPSQAAGVEESRVQALEARVADLEKRMEELQKRAPTGMARVASPEEEQAAATLLKGAQEAYVAMDIETAKAKLAELRQTYGNTRAFRAAQRVEAELAVVGREDIPLQVDAWYQGSEAEVSGGVATLYVFWEVWCPHCKREVPKLSATYDKYRDRGLTMIGLTKQTRNVSDDQVREFVEREAVNYPIAREQSDTMSEHYGVRGIPAAAVVKDGVVIWRGHPAQLTDAMLDSFLR